MADALASPTTLLASAARTATTNSDQFRLPPSARGVLIQFHATASASTPSVTCALQRMTSDAWANVLVSAALTGAGLANIVIHPSSADVANLGETDAIGDVFRVRMTAGDSDSLTYSVKAFPLA